MGIGGRSLCVHAGEKKNMRQSAKRKTLSSNAMTMVNESIGPGAFSRGRMSYQLACSCFPRRQLFLPRNAEEAACCDNSKESKEGVPQT
jgi:hypothetical protein